MPNDAPPAPRAPDANWIPAPSLALKIAVAYALLGALWIWVSGSVLHYFVRQPELEARWEEYKGWFFVAVTATFLGLALARYFKQIRQSAHLVRKSEARLQAIFSQSSIGVVVTDPAGRVQETNPAFEELLGFTAEELQHKTLHDLTPSADRDGLRAFLPRVGSAGTNRGRTAEQQFIRRNGQLIWAKVTGNALRGASGEVLALVGLVEDITARKRAEVEERRFLRSLHALNECNQMMVRAEDELELLRAICRIIVEQSDYRMAWVGFAESDAAKTLRPVAQAGLPEGYLETLHLTWADTEKGRGPAGMAIRTRQHFVVQNVATEPFFPWRDEAIRHHCAAGISLPLLRDNQAFGALTIYAAEPDAFDSAAVALLTELANDLAYGIVSLRTRDGHRRAEAALQASEAKYRRLHESMTDAFASVDLTGFVRESNRAFRDMLGYSPEELAKLTYMDLTPEKWHAFEQNIVETQILKRGYSDVYEKEYRRKDGTIFPVELRAFLMPDEAGQPMAMWAIVRDITERKRAKELLEKSREQLRALLARLQRLREEERTRIAREVHDVLGQLLTGLKMDLAWCERRYGRIAEDELRQSLQEKLATTVRLADTMIETVQKISHELRPSVLDNLGLPAALQFEARQFQERTGIACELSPVPDHLVVRPDQATGIFRIFQEILTNVARHARATRVCVEFGQSGGTLLLRVSDNGCGISAEAISDPCSLGLLGMSERAFLMGGSVDIRGQPGQGTTVTLAIPLPPA